MNNQEKQTLFSINQTTGEGEFKEFDLPIYTRHIVEPKEINTKGQSFVNKYTRGYITRITIRLPKTEIAVYPNTNAPWGEIITEEEFLKEIEHPVYLMKKVLEEVAK
jgi:hypothetical protein